MINAFSGSSRKIAAPKIMSFFSGCIDSKQSVKINYRNYNAKMSLEERLDKIRSQPKLQNQQQVRSSPEPRLVGLY